MASAGTNIKVLEALAMGRAVVATPAGVHGLDLEAGREYLEARTGAGMAEAIETACSDSGRRLALEPAALRRVERSYSWDAIAAMQRRVFQRLGSSVPG